MNQKTLFPPALVPLSPAELPAIAGVPGAYYDQCGVAARELRGVYTASDLRIVIANLELVQAAIDGRPAPTLCVRTYCNTRGVCLAPGNCGRFEIPEV